MRVNGFGRAVIEVGEVRVAVTMRGDGPDVLMIPSHGRGGADFDDLGRRLEAAGYHAIALDPRGVGESCGPADGITLHDLAADAAVVVEHLCDGPAHVIGHANGQRIARCMAADHPDLVDRLVLLASGGKLEPDPVWSLYGRVYDASLPQSERLDAVRRIFFAPGNDASAWLDGWWQAAREIQDRANAATPLEDWWQAGEAPMLVIQGGADVVARPGNGHVLKHELGERVTLVDLPGVGHAMLPEDPTGIAALVIDYLGAAEAIQ